LGEQRNADPRKITVTVKVMKKIEGTHRANFDFRATNSFDFHATNSAWEHSKIAKSWRRVKQE
jgi:hypothetical protein